MQQLVMNHHVLMEYNIHINAAISNESSCLSRVEYPYGYSNQASHLQPQVSEHRALQQRHQLVNLHQIAFWRRMSQKHAQNLPTKQSESVEQRVARKEEEENTGGANCNINANFVRNFLLKMEIM